MMLHKRTQAPTAPTAARYAPIGHLPHTPVYATTHTMVTGYAATGDYVQAHTPELFLAACRAVEWSAGWQAPTIEALYTPEELQALVAQEIPLHVIDLRHLIGKIEKFTHTMAHLHAGGRLDELPHMNIEHVIPTRETVETSTERMQTQRAAYAAQGLTARGTTFQPACTGTTKSGATCKRKANTGTATCTAHTNALV